MAMGKIWQRFSRKLRTSAKRFIYDYMPGFSGSFLYFGVKVYFPKRSHIFHEACRQGIYEAELIATICREVKPNTYYIDVGANIGLTSIPVVAQSKAKKVVSIEPSPNTMRYLNRTRDESIYADRWVVLNDAVCANRGLREFSASDESLGAFDGFVDTGRSGQRKRVEVQCATLDEIWKDLRKPIVSVIKIDVEGAELEVLRGASECIETVKPIIFSEFNKTNIQAYGYGSKEILEVVGMLTYEMFTYSTIMPIMNDSQLSFILDRREETFVLLPRK